MRALKITMFLFGLSLAFEGILDIIMPVPRAEGMGLQDCAGRSQLPMAILGATWLLVGGWIVSAARDPLRHLHTVKLARVFPLALLFALIVSVMRGDVPLREVAIDIAFNVLFVLLFLTFYARITRGETAEHKGASP